MPIDNRIKNPPPELAAALAEIRRLKLEGFKAEARYFVALRSLDESGMWKGSRAEGTGYTTFEELLGAEDFSKPARYRLFCRCADDLGVEWICANGFEAAVEVVKLPDDKASITVPTLSAREGAKREFEEWTAKHDGNDRPSAQFAERIREHHYLPPRPEPDRSRDPMAELRAENTKLRTENRALKQENGKLVRENEKIKKRLAAYEAGASTKAARKPGHPLAAQNPS